MGIIVKYDLAVRCMAISHDKATLAVGTEYGQMEESEEIWVVRVELWT